VSSPADPVPFFSAAAVNAAVDLPAAFARVMDSQRYVLAKEVQTFEENFAAYCGVGHCVSVANGTDALELGLQALGVTPGDTVVLVANAGFYGSTAVRALGAQPYYVDVDPTTLTMAPESLEASLKACRPAAIVVTHLYGYLAAMPELQALAQRYGVPILEDCAQAHGATRHGRRAGSFAELGSFSFYPTKNLGAVGDGGALVTDDAQLAQRLRRARQYGWEKKYHVVHPRGRNSRLDELQAAILNDKLPHLDANNAQRRSIAQTYRQAFAGLPLQLPPPLEADHVAHLFVLQVAQRTEFVAALQAQGIACDVHYPIADHQQAAYAEQAQAERLPVTEALCGSVISLPCFVGMRPDQVQRVVQGVKECFTQKISRAC
jgi:aminotransferase EvaB